MISQAAKKFTSSNKMDGFDRHAKAITNLYYVLDPIHPLQDINL